MKPKSHQQTHTKTSETSSNTGNNEIQTTVIKKDIKKLFDPKTGAGKRAERNAAKTVSFQESR